MAALSRENIVEDGLDPTVNNADNASGDTVVNPDGTILRFTNNNGGGSSATVTITAQKTSKDINGQGKFTRSNIALTLADGAVRMVGPLLPEVWNNASGQIVIAYGGAAAADVDVEVYSIPPYLKIS